jgi:D-alanyl-lipoteichoic acid acyltransferase DltB (MBOAT superfamily)
MLFNSYEFLVFLAVVLAAYRLARGREGARTWFLVAVSLFYYAWWHLPDLGLLCASVAANWLAAQAYFATRRRAILYGAIAANLAVLGVFKYWNFLAANLGLAGVELPPIDWALPLGISFFTFHHVMYLVDNRTADYRYSFRDYALYIVFFPQLLAGPLIRHTDIVPQFKEPPWLGRAAEALARGLLLIAIGLAKKVFLADRLVPLSDPVFEAAANGTVPTLAQALLGSLAFTFQIYFDFSGYSDVAIGIALALGFVLPVNFDAPYRAASLQDFWRRWHMTLSRFLRTYLYIPLGGNRFGVARQALALSATMLLGGLWHGAGWTFVLWGGLHGIGLAAGAVWRGAGIRLPGWVAVPLTFLFVVFCWVLFRAPTLEAALNVYQGLLGWAGPGSVPKQQTLTLLAACAAIAFLGPTSQRVAFDLVRPARWTAVAGGIALVAILIQLNRAQRYQFIYFQF